VGRGGFEQGNGEGGRNGWVSVGGFARSVAEDAGNESFSLLLHLFSSLTLSLSFLAVLVRSLDFVSS
jgi:hypothetical protein